MTKEDIKTKQGFTIIEVVLVLAIAGLIFLMVFIGLPALQRSQRDTQRRNDMSRLVTQIIQYQSNNNGDIPDSLSKFTNNTNGFLKEYMKRDTSDPSKSEFNDPLTGGHYYVKFLECTSDSDCKGLEPATRTIAIYLHAECNGENQKFKPGKNIAFIIKLEGGGYYCANN